MDKRELGKINWFTVLRIVMFFVFMTAFYYCGIVTQDESRAEQHAGAYFAAVICIFGIVWALMNPHD